MKKFVVVCLTIASLFSTATAQSGRKSIVAPSTSTTNNTAPDAIDNAETVNDYSESVPRKTRAAAPDDAGAEKQIVERAVSNDGKSASVQANEQTSGADDLVKIETNLVTIPVSVFDRNGLYIPNLQQRDFKIFEDGREQEIAYFGAAAKPFTVVLLLDTSPSTEYKIEEIQRAAIAFVDQLKAQDKVMVIEFDANINVLAEATSDRQKIYKAIKKADFGGGTSLYDAIDFSLRKRLSKIEGRKAIVLFTDGVDTTSQKSGYDTTLRLSEEADALVFPIYYNTYLENLRTAVDVDAPGVRAVDYEVGKKYVEELADATGGRVFRPDSTPGGLTAAFEGIAEELRRQYNIGYYPSDEARAGQRKRIRVRVNRPNLVVRSRDSYVVGAQTKTVKPR